MPTIEQITKTDYMQVADRLYRNQNPNGTMETPNSVYETTEKWFKEWVMTSSTSDFYEWCIADKNN